MDLTSILGVFLIRFGSQIWNISISGQVLAQGVAKTLILHKIVGGFWDQLWPKISEKHIKNTLKNQFKRNMEFVCQEALKTMPDWYRESIIIPTVLVGCFCNKSLFYYNETTVFEDSGFQKSIQIHKTNMQNWAWKRCAEFNQEGSKMVPKWEPEFG